MISWLTPFGANRLFLSKILNQLFMRIKNIFKKETVNTKSSVETLNKTQLEKVIGGTDAETTNTTTEIQEGKKGLNAVNVKLA